MDRDIPSMLLVTGGYVNIKKNNEKGRLREKLLGKLGLFVKFFFLILFFFKGEILYPYTDR